LLYKKLAGKSIDFCCHVGVVSMVFAAAAELSPAPDLESCGGRHWRRQLRRVRKKICCVAVAVAGNILLNFDGTVPTLSSLHHPFVLIIPIDIC
jgi:hypothetical protein